MKLVEVEAVEDRSRAEGGHAVILLRGVEKADGASRFRLRLIETEGLGPDAAAQLAQDMTPLAVSVTGDGLALLIAVAFAIATVITRRHANIQMAPAVCLAVTLAAINAALSVGSFFESLSKPT